MLSKITVNNEEHVIDQIPAYALDCLDEGESVQVAEHLSTCPTCRRELDHYRLVVDELPLAMAEYEPSPDLREKVLQRARESSSHRPALTQRARSPRTTWLPAWSMLSLVVILLLGASNLLLWGRMNTLQGQLQTRLTTIKLQSTAATPDATGLLVVSLDGSHGTLVVDQLPVLGDSQQYQLWLIRDGKRTSGGVFSVDEKGYKSLYIKSPEPLISYTSFGITVEPTGGSPGPTGQKVLGGDL